MLFRQWSVEKQQITPVVDRRRGVFRRQTPATVAAFDVGIRLHDAERRPLSSGGLRQLRQPVGRRVGGCDAQIGFGCTVHAEPVVSAMDKEVLQLHGAAFVHAPFAQGGVERTVAFAQFGFHEYLPHDRVDERRVHAVSPEKPCARQVAAESFGVAAETVSDGEFHCLSCPASRPVENAIWRL